MPSIAEFVLYVLELAALDVNRLCEERSDAAIQTA
jgi:hypothetical protein